MEENMFMAKNDNANVLRFIASMEKHGMRDDAEEFINKYPLSKAATIEKRFEWAQHLCEFISERQDDETVRKIRMGCACGPELGKGKKIKDIFEQTSDMNLFVEKANKLNQGFKVEYDGKDFYLIYPQCYCSCVKRINEDLPATWCYCTLGYTKKMFEYIFDREVNVELLSSVKMGNDVCKIRIIM